MIKIQYEIVALQVEDMFDKTISLTDKDEIVKSFDSIRQFIESCGWSYDEYVSRMMGWNSSN